MKTESPAPTGNLTVAQLGAVLAKSKSAPPDPKGSEGKPAAQVTSREPLPPKDGDEAEGKPPVLSQTAVPQEDDQEEVEGREASDEGQPEAQPVESPESKDEGQTDQPEAPKLPSELHDAIEIAKGDGKKGVAQLLQRVQKLVDQRDTERNKRLAAESRQTELETELETAKTGEGREARVEGQNGHPAIAKLNTQLGTVDGFIKLLRAMPNGGEMDDGEGGKVNLSGDEVAEHLDRLRDKRTELVAERKITEQTVAENFQQAHRRFNQVAEQAYPWLAKPDAPEQARMKRVLELIPGLKQLPDYKLIVGHYLRGESAAIAELKAKGQKPVTRKAPAPTEPTQVTTEAPSSKAGPADEISKAKQAVKAAEEQFKKSGKSTDMTKLESAKRALARLQK